MAMQPDLLRPGQQVGPQLPPSSEGSPHVGGGFSAARPEAAGQGHIFGAGAQAVLLVAAPQLGRTLTPLFT